jgi:hypothetical protein
MSEQPIQLVLTDDLERRRLTALFRLPLAVPILLWLVGWTILAFCAAIASWFVTLLLGRTPAAIHRFLAAYAKCVLQSYAYLYLLAERYPSFDGRDGYAVDLRIAPPSSQRRLTVLFRLPLAIPAFLILTALIGSGLSVVGRRTSLSGQGGLLTAVVVFSWFAILVRGRAQRGLRDAGAYALSYGGQFWGYMLLLTDRYPNSDPLAAVPGLPQRADPIGLEGEDDLRRSRLTVFFRALLAIPHFVWLMIWSIVAFFAVIANWFATLAMGTSPRPLHRFLAAYVRYTISVYAFVYLIANPFPGFAGAAGGYPLETHVQGPARQSRWTVLFRLVLALPAFILMSLYGSLLSVAAFLGWFASLVRGRMPAGLRNAGALSLRYQAQGLGYLMLLTDAYPYTGPCLPSSVPAEHSEPPADSSAPPTPDLPAHEPFAAAD